MQHGGDRAGQPGLCPVEPARRAGQGLVKAEKPRLPLGSEQAGQGQHQQRGEQRRLVARADRLEPKQPVVAGVGDVGGGKAALGAGFELVAQPAKANEHRLLLQARLRERGIDIVPAGGGGGLERAQILIGVEDLCMFFRRVRPLQGGQPGLVASFFLGRQGREGGGCENLRRRQQQRHSDRAPGAQQFAQLKAEEGRPPFVPAQPRAAQRRQPETAPAVGQTAERRQRREAAGRQNAVQRRIRYKQRAEGEEQVIPKQ